MFARVESMCTCFQGKSMCWWCAARRGFVLVPVVAGPPSLVGHRPNSMGDGRQSGQAQQAAGAALPGSRCRHGSHQGGSFSRLIFPPIWPCGDLPHLVLAAGACRGRGPCLPTSPLPCCKLVALPQETSLTWAKYTEHLGKSYVFTAAYTAKVGKLLADAKYDPKSSLSLETQSEDYFSLLADHRKLASLRPVARHQIYPIESFVRGLLLFR